MIERDEEIISSLEELDSTFSQINKVLQQIRGKVELIGSKNRALVEDCAIWRNFFGVEMLENRGTAIPEGGVVDAQADVQSVAETQSTIRPSSPINPFNKNTDPAQYHGDETSRFLETRIRG